MGINERKSAISRWNKLHKKQIEQISYVKDSNELRSLLHGYLAGDGYIGIRKETNTDRMHYDLGFYPDHESLIEPLVSAFKELYNKTPSVRKYKNFFAIRITSKVIVNDLLSFGNSNTHTWRVPELKNDICKINWLGGIFDSDSYVANEYIRLKSVNKFGIEDVQKLFNELGIETKIYQYVPKNKNWGINYMLDIRNSASLIKFNSMIGFNHKDKSLKLLNIINKISARVA